LLNSTQLLSLQSILINLINDVMNVPKDFSFVFDDYHLIDTKQVHDMIAFLLDHMPKQMHLVITTRSDPPLPLPRFRSQNQLTEIRAADLIFTSDETSLFFNEKLKFGLSGKDIALLESRTEGWIAGLQLAALSMQGLKDKSSFIRYFKGVDRYIVDYLVEEVLSRQHENVQNFLLQTSILDRLSGPLCDAVINQKNSQEMLIALEKANLFIFPLDNERHWFRYHHLFGDLLRHRLQQTQPDYVAELHHRAHEWYLKNGLKYEAVDHLLAEHHFDMAADLIEEIAGIDWDRGRESKLLQWFNVLPDEYITSSPLLCIFHARELFEDGDWESAEKRMQEAEQILEGNKTEYRQKKIELQGRIAVIRTMMASYRGDIPKIIQYSRQALKSLREEDLMWRSVAATMLGFAHGWSGDGDLLKAHRAFSEAKAISEAAGNIYTNLLASHSLYVIETYQGKLKEAKEKFQELIQLSEESGLSRIGIAGSNYSMLGYILCEMDNIKEGIPHIKKGIRIAELGRDTITLVGCSFNLIRAFYYMGDLAGAQGILQNIEKIALEFALPPWMSHAIAATRGIIWLAMGNLDAAAQIAQERGLSVDDELSQRREAEHLLLVRILIAQNRIDEADRLLTRLIKQAEDYDRIFTLISLRLLRALAFYKLDKLDIALDELGQALSLAEPGSFFLTFVVEGPPIADLLEKILGMKKFHFEKKYSFSRAYVRKILLAFMTRVPLKTDYGLVEPLTERELEVLRLIAAGLTNKEIAQKLFISLNTVRTHTKNINTKLNVHSRTQAAARAKELGILE
jgi:LuxR family maltose regulon positive regulatory protein